MTYIVKESDGNRRIDKFVRKMLFNAPLSFIYKMIRKKDVKVNSHKVDINYIIKEGDQIDIYISDEYLKKFKEEKNIKIKNINLNIIYEDENILIVDKPKGIIVHNFENNKNYSSLQDSVISYLYNKNEYDPNNLSSFIPSPAHRLDRNTSGITIFGKNEITLQILQELFKSHTLIEKRYYALVKGITRSSGTITNYLIKDEKKGIVKITKNSKGKLAITKYKLKEKINFKYSLVDINILTGRTHQIRVSMASINHPIIGDSKYGDFELNKYFKKNYHVESQLLHAYYFKFNQINGYLSYLSNKSFVSNLPKFYSDIIKSLSKENK